MIESLDTFGIFWGSLVQFKRFETTFKVLYSLPSSNLVLCHGILFFIFAEQEYYKLKVES